MVRTVVTSRGVFERQDGDYVLTAYYPKPGVTAADTLDAMRAESEWDFEVSPELVAEPAPTAEELQAIRLFDPAGIFARSAKRAETPSRPQPVAVERAAG